MATSSICLSSTQNIPGSPISYWAVIVTLYYSVRYIHENRLRQLLPNVISVI